MANIKDIFWKSEPKKTETRSDSVPTPENDEQFSYYTSSVSLFNALGMARSSRSLAAVYACVELISNTLACIPLRVMQVDECGHQEIVKHHPVQRIFKNKNIQTMSMEHIIKHMVGDVLLHGNGYIYIKRGVTGTVTGFRWLPSKDVSVVYNEMKDTLHYICKKASNKNIPASDMIHITKNTKDGVNGISVLDFAKNSISLAQSAEDTAKTFFDSGCNISGLLVPKVNVLNPKQRQEIQNGWSQNAGANNIQILPYGVDYMQLGSNSKDAQMLETREYNTLEICRFFGVNPVLLQDLSHTSYNTLEQVNIQFLQYCLMPYIKDIESEFTRKLFIDDDDFVVDMDEDAYLLRTDKATTASYFNSFVQSGVMSINEVRKELGMSDVENGNEHLAMYQDASKANLANTPDQEENFTDK